MAPAPRFQVAFDDADGENIVFFGNYFKLAHRALERWLPSIGIPWDDWFARPDAGAPLVHAEADYLAPLRPGQEYEVDIKVESLGRTSVQFAYVIRAPDHGLPHARLKTAHVFVARDVKRKIEIPAVLRAKLEIQAKS